MNDVGCLEVQEYIKRLQTTIKGESEIHMKPLIQETCANLFLRYMCSTRFDYDDEGFKRMVRCFDEIFWDINQGYAVDFLPWLSPFYQSLMQRLESWSAYVRKYLLDKVIDPRESKLNSQAEADDDFMDALLRTLKKEETLTKDVILYMLEDFLGGHSAVGELWKKNKIFVIFLTKIFFNFLGNLIYITLGYIAKFPQIGKRIQEEVKQIIDTHNRKVTLYDIDSMPFTTATLLECLRFQSSPIVPHVATENAQIGGYGILKDTVVFINNYELNKSEKFWENPDKFDPERFLEFVPAQKLNKNACSDAPGVLRVKKNIPHFLPFSIGKRTCIGQNLVRNYSFLMVTHILENYDVTSDNPESIKLNPACVAVPPDTYSLKFTTRI